MIQDWEIKIEESEQWENWQYTVLLGICFLEEKIKRLKVIDEMIAA